MARRRSWRAARRARPLSPAARLRALDALSLVREAERRDFHLTLGEAARERGTSVRSIRRVARGAVRRVAGEWTYAPRDDEAVRTTTVVERTEDGPQRVEVRVRGLDQASKSGRYWRAVQTGKWSRIASFEGRYVIDVRGRRRYFETRRAVLQQLDREGELRSEGLRFT